MPCPDYPFEISHTVDFTLNEQRHTFQHIRKTLVDPIGININREVTRQLNLTSLRISSANITKLEHSFSKLGRFAKSLNKNITLESIPLSETFKAPLRKVSEFFHSSLALLEQGAMIALGLAGVAFLIISAPLIELVIYIIRLFIRMLNKAWLQLKSYTRHRRYNVRRAARGRRSSYWDDS